MVTEDEVSVAALFADAAAGAVVFVGMKWRSSVEKDSSTKFDSHSSSAKSSYCRGKKMLNTNFNFVEEIHHFCNRGFIFLNLTLRIRKNQRR